MSLDAHEVAFRTALLTAGERAHYRDPNDAVKLILNDPGVRSRLVLRPDGLPDPDSAEALAAEIGVRAPYLISGMTQRIRRAGRLEARTPLELPDERSGFTGSADGGARGTAGPPKGPDMNDLIRNGPRTRGQ